VAGLTLSDGLMMELMMKLFFHKLNHKLTSEKFKNFVFFYFL
jgi:hypothetical protein